MSNKKHIKKRNMNKSMQIDVTQKQFTSTYKMKVKGTEKTNAEWLRSVVTENRQWSIVFHPGEVCSPISVEKPACDRGYKLNQWICRKRSNSLKAEFPFLPPNSWCLCEPNSGCLLSKSVLKCFRWIITWPHLHSTQRSPHTKGFRVKWEK